MGRDSPAHKNDKWSEVGLINITIHKYVIQSTFGMNTRDRNRTVTTHSPPEVKASPMLGMEVAVKDTTPINIKTRLEV